MSVINHTYSAVSFIAFILVLVPLPWHLEAWNTGTCAYMLWTGISCLIAFINSIVWDGNISNPSPTWCDITVHFMSAAAVAIPASSLCINRRLYYIASVNSVTVTKREKRRAIMADLAISLGLPILGCIIAYIPQGRRYNIFEDIGCYPRIYNTPVAFVLVYSVPIMIGLVSAVYCSLTIREFARRRMQFKTLLSSNNNLNSNRYFRLMFLAAIEILFTIPICIWIICLNARIGIEPWISWKDTHSNWNVIQKFPAFIWRGNKTDALLYELTRWLYVLAAFVFFGFFGFADEARKNYRNMFSSVAKRVGYSTGTMSSGITSTTGGKTGTANITFKGGAASLPIFVRKETTRSTNLDSIASFDEKDLCISVTSVFDDVKEKDYSPTSTSSGSSTSSLHDRDYSPPTRPPTAVVSSSPRHLEVPTNTHDVV